MAHSCSDGAAKVRPSGAGNRPALLDLIIYVKRAPKWVTVCSNWELTSGSRRPFVHERLKVRAGNGRGLGDKTESRVDGALVRP